MALLAAGALAVGVLHAAPPASAAPTRLAAVTAPPSSQGTEAAPPALHAPPDDRARSRALDTAGRVLTDRAAALRAGAGDTFERPTVAFGPRGLQYLTYKRLHRGLPVFGGDVIVATDRGGTAVTAVTTGQRRGLDGVETTPTVTAERARDIARGLLTSVTGQTAPRLTVHAAGARPRLTWETVVSGSSKDGAANLHVYVDARDGSIADRWDDVRHGVGHSYYNGDPVHIDTSGSPGAHTLVDPKRPGLRCSRVDNVPIDGADDEWGNASPTDMETSCVDALFAAQREWDMVREWLGRDGFDGNGNGFPILVGNRQPNATWSGSEVEIGRNTSGTKLIGSLDVVGHEFGHAIFQFTGGPRGGDPEAYTLDESTGDIFGTLTEHYVNHPAAIDEPDYLLGEKVDFFGPGPLRNMYDPAALGGTPCYSEPFPSGDTYAAAGVQNHWFYLLAEGSAPAGKPASPVCAGEGVTGVGLRKAAEIFMSGLHLKTAPWTYVKARQATVQSALALYPGCEEVRRVKAAWDAVTVPATPGEPDCVPNDFSVRLASPDSTVEAGRTATTVLTTTTTSGQRQQVSLSFTGAPSGATVTAQPPVVETDGSSTITLSTSATTPPGVYSITVTATGSVVRSAAYTVTVTPPAVPAWKPYTSYKAGDQVTYKGATYRCRIRHLSLPGWEPPRTPALWTKVRAGRPS
ncbi:zinc metalloprotease [Streptosporangium carneum]|uniref:Zinc metalloprotease n=1 Tax=Streptosporangium carneum TaxID=47481 RepID=A0A9W6IBS8_9ACTN|nr:zinc metalloprotease [Streptosporangium carneum]